MATDHINVEALIQGIQLNDPRLYQILHELNQGILNLQDVVFPLVIELQEPAAVVPILPAPATFTFAFQQITVRLLWSEVPNAFGYEVRKGTNWDTASFLFRTTSFQADIDPLLVGSHTFLIKTINSVGVLSDTALAQVITVPPIGSISLQSSIIDNNVLLSWSAPVSTFRILNYETYRDGNFSGTVDSTFFSFFENVQGVYEYGVIPVDVAGNKGPLAEVTIEVLTPPDYALQDSRVSTLMGTRVNVLRAPYLPSLLSNWAAQTWAEHFESRGWDQVEDQINAGYPIYIQPTVLTGSYDETVDFGVVAQNVIVTITYNFAVYSPDTVVIIRMATSEDGTTYTPFVAGASLFAPSMRYVKLRLEFTGDDDDALFELYNLTYSLSVKRENDGGKINALSSDVNGTQVFFTKPFKDIESITCTTESVREPFYVIFNFVDIPDPTHFFVYVFDSSGNRVTRVIDWKARGII